MQFSRNSGFQLFAPAPFARPKTCPAKMYPNSAPVACPMTEVIEACNQLGLGAFQGKIKFSQAYAEQGKRQGRRVRRVIPGKFLEGIGKGIC
jgi:hypothetical protein